MNTIEILLVLMLNIDHRVQQKIPIVKKIVIEKKKPLIIMQQYRMVLQQIELLKINIIHYSSRFGIPIEHKQMSMKNFEDSEI